MSIFLNKPLYFIQIKFSIIVNIFITVVVSANNDTIPGYTPFDFENGIWFTSRGGGYDGYSNSVERNYFCDGDTLIDSEKYHKLYAYEQFSNGYPGGGVVEGDAKLVYQGAIKNIGKTVEYIENDSDIPKIIYDFNLSVDDTMKTGYGGEWYDNHGEYLIISSIDSVKYCREYHKRYKYEYDSEWIIEGIGSGNGLIDPAMTIQLEYGTSFNCYMERGNVECENNCKTYLDIEKRGNETILFNLKQDARNIVISAGVKMQKIEIYNILGKKIMQINDIDAKEKVITKTGFVINGEILIVKIFLQNKILTSKIYLR